MEGLRPRVNDDGTMGFELQDGIFKKFVTRARKNYEDSQKSKETVEKELERLPDADYELCTALLTMILREDHFSNGYLRVRYEAGQVDAILNRMIDTLKS